MKDLTGSKLLHLMSGAMTGGARDLIRRLWHPVQGAEPKEGTGSVGTSGTDRSGLVQAAHAERDAGDRKSDNRGEVSRGPDLAPGNGQQQDHMRRSCDRYFTFCLIQ